MTNIIELRGGNNRKRGRIVRPYPQNALKEALSMKDKTVIMDFITDQTENVYPMIASGKGHHEMHLSSERELA